MARRLSVLIVGGLAAAVCARLGFWQVSRLHQRQALRATLVARSAMQPLDVATLPDSAPPGPADTLAYRRGFATGAFDFTRQVVVLARVVDELPGVLVATPLLLDDRRAVLVERGFFASQDAQSVDLTRLMERDTATVRGVLLRPSAVRPVLPADTTWPLHLAWDDPTRMAVRFPYPLLPWVLRRTDPAVESPKDLRPIPLPVPDNGPHLSYAIQWFAFALIAVVGSITLYRNA